MVITVTGSTGTIGAELVRLLSDAGAATRAVFRTPGRRQTLRNVVWLQADLHDAGVLEPVLAGTTRLFLLSGNEQGFGRLQIATLRAAQELGVSHVVKLSALGASNHSKSAIAREHWEVEQALQQTAMTWTILRPHAFMQNWLDDVAERRRPCPTRSSASSLARREPFATSRATTPIGSRRPGKGRGGYRIAERHLNVRLLPR
ncbi:MAG: SDR family oxidoreductase [Gemmatimonadaceae bacterium]